MSLESWAWLVDDGLMATTLSPPRHTGPNNTDAVATDSFPNTALVVDRSLRPIESVPATARSPFVLWLSDLMRRTSASFMSPRDAVLWEVDRAHTVRSIHR